MTSDLRIQGEVVVNSEQAESAFNRVGDKAQQMANEVATSAGKAGQAVDKIGDGAGASAEKFTRAESRISASIKRATNELELLGKTASQRLEFNISDKGLDPKKFEPMLQRLREVEAQAQQAQRAATGSLDKMGISAKQTAAALRGVPAQFTDIVTSLQGGQAPLTVFLQQGGQLKDMFGGAGNAARALGGYVVGLVNPFTIAAAAAGVLAIAYNQGSKEADAYNKALITTGNAAGTNAAQLKAYAQEISAVVGTQGKAAESLAALAATGKIGAESLKEAAQAAVQYERATGQAVEKTAEQFASLRNDPLAAVLKLNDGMNFLTDSTYKQIKSLEEQGKTAEAANVAQRAFADTLSGRAGEMERNLGTVERGWLAVKDAAKSAWDAILNVGRASTSVDQLAEVRKQIAQRENQIANGGFGANEGGAAFGRPSQAATERLRAELAGLQAKAAALEGVAYAAKVSADEERKRGEAVKAGAAFDKAGEKFLSDKTRMERELAAARVQGAEAGRSQAEIEKRLGEIRASYAKKGGGGVAAENKELRDQMRVFADLAGVSSTYYTELANYQKQRANNVITEQQYVQAVEALIKKQPFAVAIAKEQADATKAQAKASEEAAKAHLKYVESFGKGAAAAQQQADQLRTEEAAAVIAADGYYSLAQAIELVTIARLEEKRDGMLGNEEAYLAVQKEIDARKELVGLIGAKEARKAAEDSAKDAAREWDRAAADINRSLTDALLRGFESGKDFAQNMRDTIVNMFKTLVLRPIISAVVNPVAGALTGALGLAGTANAGTSALGTVGNIASGASMLGGLGSGFANGLSAWGSGGSVTGVLSNPGLYTGAELAGALAPIALGIGALVAIAKATKGETRTGGQFGVAFDGSVTNQRRGETYTMVGQQFDRDFTNGQNAALRDGQAYRLEGDPVGQESAIRQAVAGTAKTINTLLEKYGSEAAVSGFSAGLETSGKGRGGVFAGGLLSTGATFGESGKGDNYAGTLYEKVSTNSPDFKTALENFTLDLQQATLQALQAATDLPSYVSRVIKDVDVESLGAEDVSKLLTTIGDLPGVLLQGFGTTRDALAQQFAQGLALGDATAAGQSVADTLVASIEASLYNDAAGKIFDIVNSGIVTPMLDAIATGASVSEALSQATIDKTIERAKAQASALSELFGNAEFVSALEQIRTTVGAALGQAGDAFGYKPKYQLQAAQQIDTAAQSADQSAKDAAKAWEDINKALASDRLDADIALLRAMGQEEAALKKERERAIKGYDAQQIAMYDGTQAILSQVTALEKQAEATKLAQERAAELASTLAGELPGVLDKFLSPDQKLAAGYTGIAADLSKVGINVDPAALATASLDQIAAAAMAVYNLGATSDETRLALVRAASGLADLKAEATNLAASRTDAALAAVERAAQAQREVLQGAIDDVRAVFDAAASGVKSLRGQVDAVVQMSGKQGQAFIANALTNARTTGYLPDGKDLQDAISAVTAGFDSAIFTTQADADYQRLVVAGNLEALQSIGGEQLTEAEKALETLDAQLQAAHDQLEALRGIQGGVLSMSEALDRFGTALARESAVRGGGGGGGGGSGKPAVTLPGYLQGANGAAYDVKADMGYQAGTGLPWRGADVRSAAQQLLEADNARGVYDAIKASGFSLAQADTILGLPAGEAEEWARSVGLPVFHDGTNYVPRTGFALLEQGEAVVPRAFNPSALGGGNTERLERLVEGLTTEVQRLQAVVAEGNGHQESTAKALGSVVVNNTLITAAAPEF